jgi:hypothetical protein
LRQLHEVVGYEVWWGSFEQTFLAMVPVSSSAFFDALLLNIFCKNIYLFDDKIQGPVRVQDHLKDYDHGISEST